MRSSITWMPLAILGAAATGFAQSIEQMPGWPISVDGYHSEMRGVTFADLDGDGDLEIIVGDTVNWQIHAWDYEGNGMPGFPIALGHGAPQWAQSVGDLDGDGDLEIVACARDIYGGSGALCAFDHLGNSLPGFPIELWDSQWMAAPTLADLDGDGQLEILAGEWGYVDTTPVGSLHIFNNDGSEWGGNWPVQLDSCSVATPAVGDVDDDGNLEVCMLSGSSAFLLEVDGSVLPGWPVTLAGGDTISYSSPVLADFDGDGHREVVFSVCTYLDGVSQGGCHVQGDDGTAYPGWPQQMGWGWTYCTPTVTDLEGDGQLEVLCGSQGIIGAQSSTFWVWDANGNVRPGFPYLNSIFNGAGSDGPITVADINGDGTLEIFADAYACDYSTGEGLLYGVDSNGQNLPGFPLVTAGYTQMNGATIGDVNGDGHYELGVLSRRPVPPYAMNINLYTLPDTYASTSRDWLTYHGSNCRGGLCTIAPSQCEGDIDGDGDTDQSDLGILLAAYDVNGSGDLDGDGDTDQSDLGILLANYECGT